MPQPALLSLVRPLSPLSQDIASLTSAPSTIMLHREYFPWLPNNNSVPRAPVDPPLLEAEAPPNWWENSAAELFGAAENITLLLNEASECGVHLMTPFAGFGMFSAGFCNIYISRFPKMNLGRSRRAAELTQICAAYLQDFRQVWSIADSWVHAPTPNAMNDFR